MSAFRFALVVASVALASTTGVAAQEMRQLAQTCDATIAGGTAERIAACTKLIDSRSLSPHDQALAHMHRAWPESISGKLDLALNDLNEATRLDPQSAIVLSERGFTQLRLGRLDAAIADYTAALRRNPRTVYALYGRGIARLRNNDKGGNADLEAARVLQAGVDNLFAGLGIRP